MRFLLWSTSLSVKKKKKLEPETQNSEEDFASRGTCWSGLYCNLLTGPSSKGQPPLSGYRQLCHHPPVVHQGAFSLGTWEPALNPIPAVGRHGQTPQCSHCAPVSQPASRTCWQNQRKTVSLLLGNHRQSKEGESRQNKKLFRQGFLF